MPTKKAADPFAETDSTEDLKEKVVAETTKNEKLTVTLKGGTGFDAPWVVVHATDATDALGQLKDPSMKELLDFAAETGSYFAGLKKPAESAPSNGGAGTQAAASGDSGKFCKHGQMQHKSGVKNGKTWQGFFCPSPRGTPDQCAPEFVR
jgi:hypothetical protein